MLDKSSHEPLQNIYTLVSAVEGAGVLIGLVLVWVAFCSFISFHLIELNLIDLIRLYLGLIFSLYISLSFFGTGSFCVPNNGKGGVGDPYRYDRDNQG